MTQNRKNASGSRSDIGWEHGIEVDHDSRKIKCNYCNEVIPGNIYRFKHHLACTKINVKACNSVPIEVRKDMVRVLDKLVESPKRKIMNEEEEEIVESVSHKRGRKVGTTLDTLNQNTEKRLRDEAYPQISRIFHTHDIPFSCAKKSEFAKMFEFVPPSYHELENSSLEKEMKNTIDMLEEYIYEWKKIGCSIICDEWTDMKGRFYCNFLVNCSECTIFLKSIDTSDFSETTIKVFEVLDKIIEEIGEENVVQVITKNTANYKVAVEILIEKRKRIFWSPCVVQLLNEILEDFEKNLVYHHTTIAKGKKIIAFIYSRTKVISMLRNYANQKDLIGPTITPSATAYLNLLYLIDMKEPLVKIFSSELELTKTKEGEEIQQILQDCEFWDDIDICLNFALPIIEVILRIDSDEKPTMGFIYKEIVRAKESLQSLHNAKGYDTIWEIIKDRSNPLLHHPYIASYYLNPQLNNDSTFKFPDESIAQCCLYLATMAMTYDDNSKVTTENQLLIEHQFAEFSAHEGLFGSQAAIRERDTKDPAKWWDLYGNNCPELQRMAIRLLSLTCSSCGGGQIRNAYGQVYTKKRSYLYQKKLNDLYLGIQKFKSKTHELKFTNILPGVPSGYELRTENEVGDVSEAKKDMRVNINVNVPDGVPLPENYNRNEADRCSHNQSQNAAASAGLYDWVPDWSL